MVDITYWMEKDTPVIARGGIVFDAVIAMKDKNSDAILITENEKPIGIFTERDLLRKVVAEKKDPSLLKVDDVMTSPIETIDESSGYSEVLNSMKTRNFRHMPVVNKDQKLIGLVTLQSLIKSK